MDPYSPCICGSGKKFRWCCQGIYEQVNQAFEKESNGQHEVARRLMEKVVEKHPNNPQAHCFHAQLLRAQDKREEAEQALDKALELDKEHPFTLLLRATMRLEERELAGALSLARQAADAYPSESKDSVAETYLIIYQCEMQRNNPLAGVTALRIAMRCSPSDEELRREWEGVSQSPALPRAVREEHAFQSPSPEVSGERRKQWDQALSQVGGTQLGKVADAFRALTEQDGQDAPAWHNSGLALAWLGRNEEALEAWEKYIELEPDETKAAKIATLSQVLLLGAGLEQQSDYRTYVALYEIREAEPLVKQINVWGEAHRFIPLSRPEQGMLQGMMLEPLEGTIITTASATPKDQRLAGYLTVIQNHLSLASPREESLERMKTELREGAALAVVERKSEMTTTSFGDVVANALLFPGGTLSEEETERRMKEHFRKYFEEQWIHRPLQFLKGTAPVDAVGSPGLRKRVRGVLAFLEQCADRGVVQKYDFDGLRRKLGLLEGESAPQEEAGETAEGTASSIRAMSAAELSELVPDRLSQEEVEEAYHTARKLKAEELGRSFAESLVGRAPQSTPVDRFEVHAFLIQQALRNNDKDAALDRVNAGEKEDCEHNEGRHRNDYELWRGQVHAKRGETDEAFDIFMNLHQRDPSNLEAFTKSTEAMLSSGAPDKALKLAEEGLKAAKVEKNRDLEGHLKELAGEAKSRMGN